MGIHALTIQEAILARSLASPYWGGVVSFRDSRHTLRPSTLHGYIAGLRRFGMFFGQFQEVPLSIVTADNVNAYIADAQRRKRKFLAHHDARALRLFSAWLVKARIFASDPLLGVDVPTQPATRRKPFTDIDVSLILELARKSGCGDRDEAIIVLALYAGLRMDELRNLRLEDLDLKRRFLYVAQGKSDPRRIPLDPQVNSVLDLYVKDWRPPRTDGPLFLNAHGDPFTYYGFAAVFRRLRHRLPKEVDFKIHRARNTAITNMLRSGTDLYVAMKLAGHKSPKVTERYAGELTDDELTKLTRPSFSLIYGRKTA